MASNVLSLLSKHYVMSLNYEKLLIIVPKEWKNDSYTIETILYSPLLSVWSLSILLFTLIRKILQNIFETKSTRRSQRAFGNILFDTFGRTFGNSSYAIQNRPERILILFLLISALLADILCSGMLYELYSNRHRTPRIDSLAEFLAHSGHRPILVPALYQHDDHLEKKLHNTEYVPEFKILSYIYNGNLSNFYMLTETRAMQLFSTVDTDSSNKAKHFHIIPDTYMC